MPDRRDVAPAMIYMFDGSFAGLLCCIYESYTRKERVTELFEEDELRMSLYPTRSVETVEEHARRVYRSLESKLGAMGLDLVNHAFRCSDEDKNTVVFRFVELGYKYGTRVCNMLSDDTVIRIHRLYRTVWNERHHYLGFVRFAECPAVGSLALQGSKTALAAIIEPRHDVLSLIAGHFCDRYPEEHFIIYDKTRGQALVYRPYKAEIIELEKFELPEGCPDSLLHERLWQGYYEAVAIESRRNDKLRMQHMPKRFWEHLPEMKGESLQLP